MRSSLRFLPRFSIVGVSNGGLIARWVIQHWDDCIPLTAKGERRTLEYFISNAGPQRGIADIPAKGFPGGTYGWFGDSACWSNIWKIGACGYQYNSEEYDSWANGDSWLANLNNEGQGGCRNPDDKDNKAAKKQRDNFERINKMLLIWYAQDEMLTPHQSAIFQYEKKSGCGWIFPRWCSNTKVVEVKNEAWYKENKIGLKSLHDAGKVYVFKSEGTHTHSSEQEMKDSIVRFLNQDEEQNDRENGVGSMKSQAQAVFGPV